MKSMVIENYEKVFNKFVSSKKIHEGILLIESADGAFSFSKGYGGKEIDTPFLMASITKLFTTTCILILQEQGKLSLNDRIIKYIDSNTLSGIHVYRGRDYSFDLTISDLLFQTSGMPDAFTEGKDSVMNRAIKEDFYFDFSDVIIMAKKLRPHFEPGRKGKAYYADINFDILGEIIEKVSGLSLSSAYKKYITTPLGLMNTYLPENENEEIPQIYYRDQVIHRPKLAISCRASGGCISNARELMIFIKAFFGGKLFNRSIFSSLSRYNKLQITMGPIYYGGGYMQIPLGTILSLFMGKGELIGHSGTTGSFAFYYPLKELFFVGDLNQMADPSLPIKFIMQLAIATK